MGISIKTRHSKVLCLASSLKHIIACCLIRLNEMKRFQVLSGTMWHLWKANQRFPSECFGGQCRDQVCLARCCFHWQVGPATREQSGRCALGGPIWWFSFWDCCQTITRAHAFFLAGGAPRKQGSQWSPRWYSPALWRFSDSHGSNCFEDLACRHQTGWFFDQISSDLENAGYTDSLVGWPRLARGEDVCCNQSSVHSILDSIIEFSFQAFWDSTQILFSFEQFGCIIPCQFRPTNWFYGY